MDKRLEVVDTFAIFAVFVGTKGHNPVFDLEESERLSIHKRQSHLAVAVSLPQAIFCFFKDGKTAVFDEAERSAVRKNRMGKLAVISLVQPKIGI
jgi:hypothetical protein